MFGRGRSRDDDDPAVGPVEAALDRVATRASLDAPEGRIGAENALLFCTCISEGDAPTWLIFDEPDGEVRWARARDGAALAEVVDARHAMGGHVDRRDVLSWLRGEAYDPWSSRGDAWGDGEGLHALALKVIRPQV